MADDDDAAAKGRTSMGTDGILALPELLQHEIFSRVGDVKALFKLAVTCHGWLRRFTDRAFLRELCPSPQGSGHCARLLGIFLQGSRFKPRDMAMVQERMTTMAAPPQQNGASSSSSALAPVFLPALGSPLGSAGCALTSFIGGGDEDRTFDYAEPLAARHGIVLLRLAPRTPEEMDDDCHLFGICNPITGERHILPPFRCRNHHRSTLVGYAIITAADDGCGNERTFSQLLVISQVGVLRAHLHSYSAATRRWSAVTRRMDRRVVYMVGARSAVVHRGAAHWLCVDSERIPYKLSVEVATARGYYLTRLPIRVGGKQLLCVSSDGELAFASMYPLHLTVWSQPGGAGDDDDDTTPAAWPRTSFRIAPRQHDQERWCNFNHGSLLVLFGGSGSGSGVFILDVDTKVIEKVFILNIENKLMAGDDRYLTCVPYEMDLVEFFTLQLGGIREQLMGTTTSSKTESP